MNIGERIKERRKELNLSVDDIADKLNKNRATIYRYESNDIENLPIGVLEPLAKILQTTPGYLMGWNTNEEKIAKVITPLFKFYKENKELFNSISSHSEESLKNFNEYLSSTFSEEINALGNKLTAMDILTLYEYVNKIISFELNKLTNISKNEIKKSNNEDLTTANKEETASLEDTYTTLAAHDDDLTDVEKQNMDAKIMKTLKKRQK